MDSLYPQIQGVIINMYSLNPQIQGVLIKMYSYIPQIQGVQIIMYSSNHQIQVPDTENIRFKDEIISSWISRYFTQIFYPRVT